MEAGRAQEARWPEESDIMAQLLAPFPYCNERGQKDACFGLSSMLWSSDHAAESCYSASENVYSSSRSFCYWSQGSDTSASNLYCNSSGYESYYLSESNAAPAINPAGYCFMRDQLMSPALRVIPNPPFGDQTAANEEASSGDGGASSLILLEHSAPSHNVVSLAKRESSTSEDDSPASKRKAKAPANVPKNGRKAQSKRVQKASKSCEEEELNAANNEQNLCSCFSEGDSQTDQNRAGNTISSSKTRAGRGSATDPQSLYARKRRERINERLRTLQNLVPNGTKVDISTMLEEAVQYVKFLQLQIKLLSSDDLWMYAPIAYNGMNIGLDLKISPPQ